MNDLTLIIPAKFESESLPLVLEEIKGLECKKKVILESSIKKQLSQFKNLIVKLFIKRTRDMVML